MVSDTPECTTLEQEHPIKDSQGTEKFSRGNNSGTSGK